MGSQTFKVPVAPGTKIKDWRTAYNDAITTLLENSIGATDPAVAGDAYAVNGSFWDDSGNSLLKHRAGGAWYSIFQTGKSWGGLMPRGVTVPWEIAQDLDGYNLILDQGGTLKLVNDRDGAVAAKQLVIREGATDVLLIDAAAGTKLLDLKSQLRLKNPEGWAAVAPGAATNKFPIETTAGTRYVMCSTT
jgi:hypothetical protein